MSKNLESVISAWCWFWLLLAVAACQHVHNTASVDLPSPNLFTGKWRYDSSRTRLYSLEHHLLATAGQREAGTWVNFDNAIWVGPGGSRRFVTCYADTILVQPEGIAKTHSNRFIVVKCSADQLILRSEVPDSTYIWTCLYYYSR